MKNEDDFYADEPEEAGRGMLGFTILVSVLAVLAIVAIVLIINRDKINFSKKPQVSAKEEYSGYVNLEDYVSGNTFVSDDLDIWDEYLDKPETEEGELEVEEEPKEEAKVDLSEGGTKTKVVMSDGKENWVKINKYLAPNELDDASFVLKLRMIPPYTFQC